MSETTNSKVRLQWVKGQSANLPEAGAATEGKIYLTEDKGGMYLGTAEGDLTQVGLTSEQVDTKLAEKVDKVDGKSLVADTEIARLANVDNYNDTEVRGLIGDNAGAIEAINNTIGDVAEGKTVVEMIADAAAVASGDSTKVAEDLADYIASNDEALADVKATADAAAVKTEVDEQIADLEAAITDEETRAKGVEESLQNQINTIMNNPDTEGVINSINEFTQYINDHGEIAEGFRTDIDKNKADIDAINNETTGILKQAKDYADNQIDAIPLATVEVDGLMSKEDKAHLNAIDSVIKAEIAATKVVAAKADAALKAEIDADIAEQAATTASEIARIDEVIATLSSKEDTDELIGMVTDKADAALTQIANITWDNLGNKPFGDVIGRTSTLIERTGVPGTYSAKMYAQNSDMSPFVSMTPIPGNKYIVAFGDEEFICDCVNDGYSEELWGNIYTLYCNGVAYAAVCTSYTTMAYSVFFYYDKEGTYDVGIYTAGNVVKTIEDRFIPDTIARIDSISWNDLNDKPFYEIADPSGDKNLLIEASASEMDGSSSGTYHIYRGAGINFVKGTLYQVTLGGNTSVVKCEDDGKLLVGNGEIYKSDYGPGEGSLGFSGISRCDVSIYEILPTVVTLDSKFLSDTIARITDIEALEAKHDEDIVEANKAHTALQEQLDAIPTPTWEALPDKPFYVTDEVTDEMVVVFTTDVFHLDSTSDGRHFASASTNLKFTQGKVYQVTVGDETKIVKCERDHELDFNEQISIETVPPAGLILFYGVENSNTFAQICEAALKVVTLDEKFIPETIARTADVEALAETVYTKEETYTKAEVEALVEELFTWGTF